MDPKSILDVEFNETTGMIVAKDIDFFSLCEQHLLPFFGRIHIGYIPNTKVVGVSKLVRLVDCFTRRLQLQERITREIADSLDKYLKPSGVIVVAEATHMCMRMKGRETLVRSRRPRSAVRSKMQNLAKSSLIC
jgi:GTP cyclohydrolase IA